MTTESVHNIIITYLNLNHLTTNSRKAIVKRKAVKRTVFLYEEVKEKNWEQFRIELDRILKNKKALGLCEKQLIHGNEQDHLDEIWGIIKRAIIEAANKSLLKKKMRFIRDRLGLPIEETNKLKFNLTIEKINTDLQLEIQQAEDIWTEDTLVNLKGWWKIIKERNSKEIENATNKEISRRIKEWSIRKGRPLYMTNFKPGAKWYKSLDEEILEEEWVDMLKKLKGKSAPDQSGTKALATELRLRQRFNDTRIVNVMSDLGKIDNIKKIWKVNLAYLVLLKAEELKFHFNFSSELWQIEQSRTPLNVVLGKLITWSQLKLCKKQSRRGRKPRWFIALKNCLIGDRRNRKLVPKYVISGYNLLALFIALLAVSLDKRKKELVLVENKDNDRKIFKIVQKGKAKILSEHYCNIPLADPNQFEIKKCKGCSGTIAKMTGKINEK
ncbi:6182_t:CDS:2, partial [Gigaspora margarita]